MKKLSFLAVLLSISTLQGVAQKTSTEAEKAALVQAEADFEAARAQKGLEGWLSFFAEDAADFSSSGPITFSKTAMRARLEKTWNPSVTLRWQPLKADVASSGDLGYTVGTWQLVGKNRKGDPVSMKGKYMTAWKKQADGKWKVVADMGNTDEE
jgi:ketosteroid isomerase-like protein